MIHEHSSVMVTRKRSKVDEHCKEKTAPTTEESLKQCSVCQTSETPLWRSGPDGPKSLCNACGIRYSKRTRMESKRVEECKPAGTTCKSAGKSALDMEEMKRRQREKQEKTLKILLRRRSDSKERWPKWSLASLDGSDGEEVAEAAQLLLSLSSGLSFHSYLHLTIACAAPCR